jgi:hypothetical protein
MALLFFFPTLPLEQFKLRQLPFRSRWLKGSANALAMLEILGLSSLVSMAECIHQAPLPHYVIFG